VVGLGRFVPNLRVFEQTALVVAVLVVAVLAVAVLAIAVLAVAVPAAAALSGTAVADIAAVAVADADMPTESAVARFGTGCWWLSMLL
jgi:hypothetical protein